ncbi:formate dehydrogenase subunit gamma [Pseudogemmobacter sp. W21_MBD1_M6]|uniref:formate dehydrogenase subunit gamma n=1 Tax=Pseudogemmobacter sp. W21_MBD1_M6 TaxID=3240271 RepID=UPI003F95192C
MMVSAQPVFAQDQDMVVPPADRAATGGAQTLQDILERQKGVAIDDTFRSGVTGADNVPPPPDSPLATRGGPSDADVYRGMRYNTLDVKASNNGPASDVFIQDGGMRWLTLRAGPVSTYGGYALLGMIGLLALFYVLRGRIMVDGGLAGITIERFKPVERFGHWLIAGSFILLGLTGLTTLFGRVALIPLVGHDAFSPVAIGAKWIHNNVSWAFMLGLVLVFVMWVAHNIPNRLDLIWLAKGGGLFSKHSHPSAKKFNAGQKIIFWSVIVLGASISVSGLSLLFPFEMPLFAATFAKLNALGLPGLVGLDALPTALAPQEEMQLAQIWHVIVSFALMVIIIAHIYIGSVGMQGAYDAMGDGDVDLEWARQHHDLWVEEVQAKQSGAEKSATPAE